MCVSSRSIFSEGEVDYFYLFGYFVTIPLLALKLSNYRHRMEIATPSVDFRKFSFGREVADFFLVI